MKTKSILVILLLGVTLSCNEKNLELKPATETEEVFFDGTPAFRSAIFGVYTKLIWLYNNHSCCSGWAGVENVNPRLILMADDDLTNTGNDLVDTYSIVPSNPRVGDAFRRVYEVIFRANIVLEKLEATKARLIPEGKMTEQDYNNIRGEALFLRAYAYYLAYNLWETAPIVLQRFTEFDQISTAQSNGIDILNLIIEDMDEAEGLLPVGPMGWDDANRGRVTSGGAKMLMGKAFMLRAAATTSTADYASAAAKLGEIEGQGYTLMAQYGDNFRIDRENNAEVLFELQFANSPGGTNGWLDNDFFDVIGTIAANRAPLSVAKNSHTGEYYVPTRSLQRTFQETDPRRAWTFYKDGDPFGNTTYSGAGSPTSAHVSKYLKENSADPAVGLKVQGQQENSDFNNERIFRLSDALLLRAEALLESGGSPADVIGLINRVRQRARNSVPAGSAPAAEPADRSTSETNPAIIHQWIRDERRMELAFEGHRLFDLRRWHRSNKINLANFTQEDWGTINGTVSWEPRDIRFPYPQSELDINTALRQNDGY
jgi:hypothetical protein